MVILHEILIFLIVALQVASELEIWFSGYRFSTLLAGCLLECLPPKEE